MKLVVTVSLLVLLLAAPAVSQGPDEFLIVPGQSIGRVKLENRIDEIIQLHGNPSEVLTRFSPLLGQDIALPVPTTYIWGNVGLILVTRDRVKIEYIFLTAGELTGSYKTVQGIAKDTPRTDVERVYGQPTARTTALEFSSTVKEERWIYDKSGFFVQMFLGKVSNLGVFRPGEAKNNWKF